MSAQQHPTTGRAAAFEPLEQRRLLTVQLQDGFLIIDGTNSDDEIILSLDADDRRTLIVDDNGQRHTFTLRQLALDVKGAFVTLGPGADLFEVDQTNGAIRFAIQVLGGSGDDTIIGGGGHDALYGQGQSDSIRGGSGDDRIDGGDDNDTITGDRGDDHIFGREGDDFIRGRAGNDFIRDTEKLRSRN